MKRFQNGQRVFVNKSDDGHDIQAFGTVRRLRRADDGAWISLDQRHPTARHPFPADDPSGRGNHIMAFPEDCEVPK